MGILGPVLEIASETGSSIARSGHQSLLNLGAAPHELRTKLRLVFFTSRCIIVRAPYAIMVYVCCTACVVVLMGPS